MRRQPSPSPVRCQHGNSHRVVRLPLSLSLSLSLSHAALPLALRQGYPSTYTVTGCSRAADCGVFSLVPANCTDNSVFGCCPGGAYANGNTDRSLCDSAPVYQSPDGTRVLFRIYGGTSTRWWVTGRSALDDCYGGGTWYLHSALNPGRLGSAPTAPGYSAGGGWYDANNGQHGSIRVTAGGGH